MRLRDIPPDVLEEIRKFVRENWGKMQVTSRYTDKTLQKEIERRWGYRLNPAQISRLYRGRVKVSVQLTEEEVQLLEDNYGSASKGVKIAVKDLINRIPKIPEDIEPLYMALRGRRVTMEELDAVCKQMGLDTNRVLAELKSVGVLDVEEFGVFRIRERRKPTELETLFLLGGMFG